MEDLEGRPLLLGESLGSRFSRFYALWGRTLTASLAVALAVALVLVVVFVSLYAAEVNDKTSDSSGGGDSGFVTSCVAPFEPPTEAWLATMRQGLRQRLLSPAVWQDEAGGGADGLLLLVGLDLTYRNDVELEFYQETSFLYLTGVDEPGYSVLIDIASGRTTLFMPARDSTYAIWNGKVLQPAEVKAKYGVDEVLYAPQLAAALYNRTNQAALPVYTLVATAGQRFLTNYTVDNSTLIKALNFVRPVKSAEEIELIRIATDVSAAAHVHLMKSIKPGAFEYNMDGLFINLCYACGLAHQSYRPIAGAGEASAILHYTDNNAVMQNGQIFLVDAGGQYLGYTTDITRSYPVNGEWTEDQVLVYELVLDLQTKGISMMQPAADYPTLSAELRSYYNRLLLKAGFVQGELSGLDANSISTYFCPHGFVHHVGLDVHDPGTIGVLKPGYTLTMEPGLYFMDALLRPALNNSKLAPYLVKDKILHFLDTKFGGVRIEDVVLITAQGNRVLSAGVPKSVAAIQRLMQPQH
ncbi:aminopeptidase p, nterminal domain containing protein [Acanthamoeba castellanii str. Neff]|uniref:Aminopeptidase p, nterminal domain containing protein n=1 Tax=Acanthamoeba castellanii (strain ATCC 30010 / Neff) TaxID=1257118 RepID=L8GW77_ACACF|nr:aminopeptidase p, nterminal domain containing protein [Acanthamoeba castellanii str. Neff]ELR17474.1 aminopeptidase p, nterminal domain containing protein [Acanthamoeba castellanii str. Neff]